MTTTLQDLDEVLASYDNDDHFGALDAANFLGKHAPEIRAALEAAQSPDATLLRFYSVSTYPELVVAMEDHVLKLIDTCKRNVKPWEDTFPPTLLPKFEREQMQAKATDDTKRLDFIDENEISLVSHREQVGDGEYSIWWTACKDEKSISGHPLGYVRDAIDAAHLKAAQQKEHGDEVTSKLTGVGPLDTPVAGNYVGPPSPPNDAAPPAGGQDAN